MYKDALMIIELSQPVMMSILSGSSVMLGGGHEVGTC